MIIIYTQNETFIRKDADAAKDILTSVYGEKLGAEAYTTVKNAREGASYRKNGGPLVRVVTKEQAAEIRKKETLRGGCGHPVSRRLPQCREAVLSEEDVRGESGCGILSLRRS